jgi:hypothetical protein
LDDLEKGGGDEGDRTPDPVNAIHVLSQLSYIPVFGFKLQVSRFRVKPELKYYGLRAIFSTLNLKLETRNLLDPGRQQRASRVRRIGKPILDLADDAVKIDVLAPDDDNYITRAVLLFIDRETDHGRVAVFLSDGLVVERVRVETDGLAKGNFHKPFNLAFREAIPKPRDSGLTCGGEP